MVALIDKSGIALVANAGCDRNFLCSTFFTALNANDRPHGQHIVHRLAKLLNLESMFRPGNLGPQVQCCDKSPIAWVRGCILI